MKQNMFPLSLAAVPTSSVNKHSITRPRPHYLAWHWAISPQLGQTKSPYFQTMREGPWGGRPLLPAPEAKLPQGLLGASLFNLTDVLL